jgi:hypothetical protein
MKVNKNLISIFLTVDVTQFLHFKASINVRGTYKSVHSIYHALGGGLG